MYSPNEDLESVKLLLMSDSTLLSLLGLSNKPIKEISKSIIKRSRWDDLVINEMRLCLFFIPSRRIGNESFFQDVLELNCHVPAVQDYIAWQVQERIFELFHKKKINNRYLYADPPLGELPTMPGFFCCGTRFKFYRTI